MGERCAFHVTQEHELYQLALRAHEFSSLPVCSFISLLMLSISANTGYTDILKSGFLILGTYNVVLETFDIHFVNSWL